MAASKDEGATTKKRTPKPKTPAESPTDGKPRLLTGGNPQIPKGDGDAPVQAWIKAAPGWKSRVGAQIDRLVAETVPGVRKAVKWNQPFYGAPGSNSWFLAQHCLTRYIKVAFFNGAALTPMPPVESKHKTVRYLHVFEDQPLDEDQFRDWVAQAAKADGTTL